MPKVRGSSARRNRIPSSERLERIASPPGDPQAVPACSPASDAIVTRLLISDGLDKPTQCLSVRGTEAEVLASAQRMASRTRGCVTIAVVVAQYHRRACDLKPEGGVEHKEN